MAPRVVHLKEIERLRAVRWRTAPGRRIADEAGALRLIRELGFVLLMPISGAELPSLHAATRDPWAWWDWKQTLPGRKACYYGKVLRRRGAFIAWEWFPAFFAAYADPRSYQRLYREGVLDRIEKQILDLIADRGPLLTSEVRLALGPRTRGHTRRVKAALVELQRRFLLTAAGGDTHGWSHHRWDLVARWVPSRRLAQAQRLHPDDARAALARRHLQNLLIATPADLAWTFGWDRRTAHAVASRLLAQGRAQPVCVVDLQCEALAPRPWPGQGRAASQ